MNPEERLKLIEKLAQIDPFLVLNPEEEAVAFYDTTIARLKYADLN